MVIVWPWPLPLLLSLEDDADADAALRTTERMRSSSGMDEVVGVREVCSSSLWSMSMAMVDALLQILAVSSSSRVNDPSLVSYN